MTRSAPLALVLCLCSPAAAALDGTWRSSSQMIGPDRVHLDVSFAGTQNTGTTFAMDALAGLSAEQVHAVTETPVRFTLDREAGRVEFEGSFRAAKGKGRFTFVGKPEYFESLRKLGIEDSAPDRRDGSESIDERLLAFTLLDLSTDYIRSMLAEGYRESLDQYLALRIFDVTPEHTRAMQELGSRKPTADELVASRVHGVTPDFVREMHEAGWDLSFDELVQARIHGVTPELCKEMAQLGYHLSFEELTAFRIHGVTPDWIAELRELGYEHLDAGELVSTRIFGVTAEFIRKVGAAGYGYLPMSELISMRIQGIDADDLARRSEM